MVGMTRIMFKLTQWFGEGSGDIYNGKCDELRWSGLLYLLENNAITDPHGQNHTILLIITGIYEIRWLFLRTNLVHFCNHFTLYTMAAQKTRCN